LADSVGGALAVASIDHAWTTSNAEVVKVSMPTLANALYLRNIDESSLKLRKCLFCRGWFRATNLSVSGFDELRGESTRLE
jgi:hypothetical protein